MKQKDEMTEPQFFLEPPGDWSEPGSAGIPAGEFQRPGFRRQGCRRSQEFMGRAHGGPALRQYEAPRSCERRAAVLPKGEGWGEGKQDDSDFPA